MRGKRGLKWFVQRYNGLWVFFKIYIMQFSSIHRMPPCIRTPKTDQFHQATLLRQSGQKGDFKRKLEKLVGTASKKRIIIMFLPLIVANEMPVRSRNEPHVHGTC